MSSKVDSAEKIRKMMIWLEMSVEGLPQEENEDRKKELFDVFFEKLGENTLRLSMEDIHEAAEILEFEPAYVYEKKLVNSIPYEVQAMRAKDAVRGDRMEVEREKDNEVEEIEEEIERGMDASSFVARQRNALNNPTSSLGSSTSSSFASSPRGSDDLDGSGLHDVPERPNRRDRAFSVMSYLNDINAKANSRNQGPQNNFVAPQVSMAPRNKASRKRYGAPASREPSTSSPCPSVQGVRRKTPNLPIPQESSRRSPSLVPSIRDSEVDYDDAPDYIPPESEASGSPRMLSEDALEPIGEKEEEAENDGNEERMDAVDHIGAEETVAEVAEEERMDVEDNVREEEEAVAEVQQKTHQEPGPSCQIGDQLAQNINESETAKKSAEKVEKNGKERKEVPKRTQKDSFKKSNPKEIKARVAKMAEKHKDILDYFGEDELYQDVKRSQLMKRSDILEQVIKKRGEIDSGLTKEKLEEAQDVRLWDIMALMLREDRTIYFEDPLKNYLQKKLKMHRSDISDYLHQLQRKMEKNYVLRRDTTMERIFEDVRQKVDQKDEIIKAIVKEVKNCPYVCKLNEKWAKKIAEFVGMEPNELKVKYTDLFNKTKHTENTVDNYSEIINNYLNGSKIIEATIYPDNRKIVKTAVAKILQKSSYMLQVRGCDIEQLVDGLHLGRIQDEIRREFKRQIKIIYQRQGPEPEEKDEMDPRSELKPYIHRASDDDGFVVPQLPASSSRASSSRRSMSQDLREAGPSEPAGARTPPPATSPPRDLKVSESASTRSTPVRLSSRQPASPPAEEAQAPVGPVSRRSSSRRGQSRASKTSPAPNRRSSQTPAELSDQPSASADPQAPIQAGRAKASVSPKSSRSSSRQGQSRASKSSPAELSDQPSTSADPQAPTPARKARAPARKTRASARKTRASARRAQTPGSPASSRSSSRSIYEDYQPPTPSRAPGPSGKLQKLKEQKRKAAPCNILPHEKITTVTFWNYVSNKKEYLNLLKIDETEVADITTIGCIGKNGNVLSDRIWAEDKIDSEEKHIHLVHMVLPAGYERVEDPQEDSRPEQEEEPEASRRRRAQKRPASGGRGKNKKSKED